MVLHSKYATEYNRVSFLAIFETVLFVFISWCIFLYFGLSYYLFAPILLAPFLLLKTKESIELSHYIFLIKLNIDENKPLKSIWVWGIFIFSTANSYYFSKFLINYLELRSSWQDIGYLIFIEFIALFITSIITSTFISSISTAKVMITIAIMVGIATIFGSFCASINSDIGLGIAFTSIIIILSILVSAVMGSGIVMITLNLIIAFIFITPGILLGYLVRALISKIVSTTYIFFKLFFLTLLSIPENYKEQILINDILVNPELLPEISKKYKGYSLFGLFDEFKHADNFIEKIFSIMAIPFFSLAYLYRWSVKSTAWFYFPLFLITDASLLRDKIKRKIDIDLQSDILWLKGYKFISFLLLCYYFSTYLQNTFEYVYPSSTFIFEFIQKYPFVGNILHLYSIYVITSIALLSWCILVFSYIQKARRSDGNPEFSEKLNQFFFWLIRLRLALWYIAFGISLYFLVNEHIHEISNSLFHIY